MSRFQKQSVRKIDPTSTPDALAENWVMQIEENIQHQHFFMFIGGIKADR